ncbi:MAG: hypothetical protein JW913_12450 [Chitinispirillaceae bacterium]|nr:hypothetical protein [Chitinispirillaceae bacterium]
MDVPPYNPDLFKNGTEDCFESSQREAVKSWIEYSSEMKTEHENILKQIWMTDSDLNFARMAYPVGGFKGFPDFVDMALNACDKIRMFNIDKEGILLDEPAMTTTIEKWETVTQGHLKNISAQIDNILLNSTEIKECDVVFLQKCYTNKGELLEYSKILHVETYLTEAMFEKAFLFLQKQNTEKDTFITPIGFVNVKSPSIKKIMETIDNTLQQTTVKDGLQKLKLRGNLIKEAILFYKMNLHNREKHPVFNKIKEEVTNPVISQLELEYDSNELAIQNHTYQQEDTTAGSVPKVGRNGKEGRKKIIDTWEELSLYRMNEDKILRYRVGEKGKIKAVHCDTLGLNKGEFEILFVVLENKSISRIRNKTARSIETNVCFPRLIVI